MRLLTKSIVYYLFISLPLVFVAGFAAYYEIRDDVREGTDEALKKEKQNAFYLIQKLNLSSTFYLSSDSLSSIQISPTYLLDDCHIRNERLFDKEENESEDYRVLSCYYNFQGKTYLVSIAKPDFEEDELIEGLFSSFFLVIGFLILAFFIVNWLISKKLWQPFYSTIRLLENYKLNEHKILQFEKTNISEFKQLNEVLNRMTNKVYRDFLQQKEFTENASHELQTPLAVIKANLDNLFQSTHLKEGELNQLQSIEKAVSKLSALNKALLLITKIENKQFKEIQTINLNELTTQLLDDYQNLYPEKQIIANKIFSTEKIVEVNPVLIELLIGNLIKNAFRHNYVNGSISIEIAENHFSITNTGQALSIEKSELFNRFKKNEASSESLGLGLAIVKSIAEVYNYSVTYDFKNNSHTFTLNFN